MMTLDVRSAREYARGHVPHARHVPYWRLLLGRPSWLSPEEPVVVYCGHGPRAWIAKAALRARGHRHVSLLAGHMRAWRRAGKPLE